MKKRIELLGKQLSITGPYIPTLTAAPAFTTEETALEEYQIYTVRWGGTLKYIANLYKIDVNILKEYNQGLDENTWLHPEQKVYIPKKILSESRPYTYMMYYVMYGGILEAIAYTFGIDVYEIYAYNPYLSSMPWLSKGTIVYVPDVPRAEYLEKEVVRLVNIEREKVGLWPLEIDPILSKAARMKSEDMASIPYFSHSSCRYGSSLVLISYMGAKWKLAGENIASGYITPAGVVNGWMNSEGHKKQILSPRFNKIGIGMAMSYKNYRFYWTQIFAETWS